MTNLKNIILSSIIIILLGLGLFFYIKNKKAAVVVPNNQEVVCTEDVMQCLDGTSVSRIPPSCVFEACPIAVTTQGWKTKIDTAGKVEFKYPESIGKNFIHTVDWPPAGQVLDQKFSCTEAGTGGARAGETRLVKVNNKDYCVTRVSEGAAGTNYIQYAYAREIEQKTVILTFTMKYPHCGNYDEPTATLCQTERSAFNLDNLVDNIFGTLKIIE